LDAPIRREHPERNLHSTEPERFFGPGDSQVSAAAPLVKAALVHLGEIWPQRVRFEDLVSAARLRVERSTSPPSIVSAAELSGLEDSLTQCCGAGIIAANVKW